MTGLNAADSIDHAKIAETEVRPGHEDRQSVVRPSLIAIAIQLLPLTLTLIGAYLILGWLESYLLADYAAGLQHIQYIWYCFLRVVIVLEIVRRYYNSILIFSEHDMLYLSGRCSLQLHTSRIKYSDIREVRVEQSLLGRFLHFGDLLIGTASTSGYEGKFKYLPGPKRLAQWIQTNKLEANLKNSQDD